MKHFAGTNFVTISAAALQQDPSRIFRATGPGPRLEVLVPDVSPFAIKSNRALRASEVLQKVTILRDNPPNQQRAVAGATIRDSAGRVRANLPPPGSVRAAKENGMSMQLDVARASTSARIGRAGQPLVANPNIFGTIGRVLGGAAQGLLRGGPLGAIGGAVGGFAAVPPVLGPTKTDLFLRSPQGVPQLPSRTQEGQRIVRERNLRMPFGLGGVESRDVFAFGPGGVSGEAGTRLACVSGFHPNKTSYFVMNGGNPVFVAEGTRCVRNRRRNAFNGRANRRAISRIKAAKKVQDELKRITVRARR